MSVLAKISVRFFMKKNVNLKRIRLSADCYHWDSNLESFVCNLTKTDKIGLWHKCLGQISLSTICTTIGLKTIFGIPILKSDTHNFYNECPILK